MKLKILAELKKKFPGLQNEFLLFIAAKLEAKVKEDSEIEGAITELDTILPIKEQADFFQSESDRRVTEAKKKFEAEKKPADETKKDDKPEELTGDAKTMEMLKTLSDKLEAFEKKESISKLSEKFKLKLAEKKIPLQFAKRVVIESEDQMDALLTEVEADYNDVIQSKTDQDLEVSTPPKGGNGKTSKLASKEEVADVVNSIM